jgi:hypothetical protein
MAKVEYKRSVMHSKLYKVELSSTLSMSMCVADGLSQAREFRLGDSSKVRGVRRC